MSEWGVPTPSSDPHHLPPTHRNKLLHSEHFLKVLPKYSCKSTWSTRYLVRSPLRTVYRALLCYFNNTVNNLVNIYTEKTPAADGLLIVLHTCESNIQAIGQTALTTALKMQSQQQRASSEGITTATGDFWVVPLEMFHFRRPIPTAFPSNCASYTASGSGWDPAVPHWASRKILGGFVLFSATCGHPLLFKMVTGWWNDPPQKNRARITHVQDTFNIHCTRQEYKHSKHSVLHCTNTLKCAVLKNNGSTNICCYKKKPSRNQPDFDALYFQPGFSFSVHSCKFWFVAGLKQKINFLLKTT